MQMMKRMKAGQTNRARYRKDISVNQINFSTVVPVMMTQQGNSLIYYRSLLLEVEYEGKVVTQKNTLLIANFI